MSFDEELPQRTALIAACRQMNSLGINQGTSGNISIRFRERMLISPSAIPYDRMQPDQIASIRLDGEGGWHGPCAPSTEWRIHLAVLRARPDIGAVVHGHPPHATALSIARRGIPACHYMVAAFGGNDVPCAGYATYGTDELAQLALAALQHRQACLLANHGVVVCGPNLRRSMWLAEELETLARQYWLSLQIGGPVLLDDSAIAATKAKLDGYGVKS